MNAADRHTIHKLAEEYGLTTVSEGFGRDRHIVLRPAGAPSESEEPDAEEQAEEA